jgi:hypothetical protein
MLVRDGAGCGTRPALSALQSFYIERGITQHMLKGRMQACGEYVNTTP